MRMKNILITGGAGFIGTNLTKCLLEEGNKVFVVDNLFTGRLSNTIQFRDNKNYVFLNADITNKNDYPLIEAFIRKFFENKLDEIYNLACPASPPKYQIDPLYTIDVNLAVRDLAELALKYDAKFMHSSTSEVYGDPDDKHHPQSEDYRGNVNPIGPRACYDEGKRIAETILYEYFNKRGLKLKLIRIFNTYGPWMDPDDGRVVSNFICQALRGEDLTVYGDGTQTRSFQYIDDLIEGMLAMMETEDEFMGPVNIGSEEEFDMLTLAAEILIKIPDTKSKSVQKDLPIDDPLQRKADTTRLREKTGWKPKVDLFTGLDKTIEYFKTIVPKQSY